MFVFIGFRPNTGIIEGHVDHDVVRVEPLAAFGVVPARLPTPSLADLAVASFDREVDLTWRRTSYSGLTRDAHEAGPAVSSEAEAPGKDDEPEAIRNRLAVYEKQTAPVLQWYRTHGTKVAVIDAVGPVQDVTARALGVLAS